MMYGLCSIVSVPDPCVSVVNIFPLYARDGSKVRWRLDVIYDGIKIDTQWEVNRFFRIYLIMRRFFDRVWLGSISLGLDLVSDLVFDILLSRSRYLTFSDSLSLYPSTTLCIHASDTTPPRCKPLEQCINHLQLSKFLHANSLQTRPVGAFPEQLLLARGQWST